MQPFSYRHVGTVERALDVDNDAGIETPPTGAAAQFIAGGTNITDLMKLEVMQPSLLVDINELAHEQYGRIEVGNDGLRLGALVRMADAEEHPQIKRDYPVMAEALQQAASQQIRNMASLGGNVLQRTRCEYFRESSWPCNKRDPGSGCSAIQGINRQHAVLGTSDTCIATYPGDFAQALIALDAVIETRSATGARLIKFADLHRLPGDTPHIETILQSGELITFINIPNGPWTRRSHYLKVRDRDSYAFALASAAIALDLEGQTVRAARIALGGVATKPWRATEAEQALLGKPLTEATAHQAADAAFAAAKALDHNAFKIPLGKQTLVRALLETRNMQV